jgi:HSP20 family protein
MAIDRWRSFGSPLTRWEPFREVGDIQHEVNRLFDSFFGRPAMVPAAERAWVPLCDMHETKDDLYVTLEVPGVREKDIQVAIIGDLLTVKGERKWEKELKDDSVYRVERIYGKFERTVPLPVPVQADKVTASYRDGVLEIKLPKAEEVRPKEIKIDIA